MGSDSFLMSEFRFGFGFKPDAGCVERRAAASTSGESREERPWERQFIG
jgi:hypothetical protein